MKDGDGLWGLSGMLRSKLRELGKGLPIDAMGKLGAADRGALTRRDPDEVHDPRR